MLETLVTFILLKTFHTSVLSFDQTFPETFASRPQKKPEAIAPFLSAKSYFSIDLKTQTPLLEKNIFERRPIASISKLVTAMIILERHSFDEVVTVSKQATNQTGTKIWLIPGEKITVRNLMKALLIHSANDAAVALAEHDSGNEAAFTRKMNEKAQALGLLDTHFTNATGLDEEGNYSTAFDIIHFSREALTYPFIRETVATKEGILTSVDGKIKHKLDATNELLGNKYFHVIGLKTGRTTGAGPSFVSLATDGKGHEILSVVLDSPDRFQETKVLLDWLFRSYVFP